MEGLPSPRTEIFFDPFAAEGGQFYDPAAQLEATFAKYRQGLIADAPGALDRLVVEVESSMMDMHFLGMFVEMQHIAAQAHAMCGEDHAALQRLGASDYLTSLFGSEQNQQQHNHTGHKHEDDEDDEEDD